MQPLRSEQPGPIHDQHVDLLLSGVKRTDVRAQTPTHFMDRRSVCIPDDSDPETVQQPRTQQFADHALAQGAAGGNPPAWNEPDGSGSGSPPALSPRSSK